MFCMDSFLQLLLLGGYSVPTVVHSMFHGKIPLIAHEPHYENRKFWIMEVAMVVHIVVIIIYL